MEIKRCVNCMEKTTSGVCPECGFDPSQEKPMSYALEWNSILHGRYLVGKVLGHGGFGITYIGFDLSLNTKVAIKEYFPFGYALRDSTHNNNICWNNSLFDQEQWESGCNSFLREARRMAQIDTIQEVVRVRDIFMENNTAYIVMDYVKGITLRDTIKTQGKMNFKDCLNMMSPLANAIQQIHDRNVIHRDINPNNIMVMPDGGVKLLDFGAAKDFTVGKSGNSQLVATMGFSPPEQYVKGGIIGPWTDVYALCATMVYMVTGKKPPESVERMINDTLDLEPDKKSGLTEEVVKVLKAGLELRTGQRIQNVKELFSRLQKAAHDETETKQTETVSVSQDKGAAGASVGIGGAQNVLTREEIANAEAIIVTADQEIEMARFDGKPVPQVSVADDIHKAKKPIERDSSDQAPIYHHVDESDSSPASVGAGDRVGKRIYKNLMNIPHMLPFIIGGGILIALVFLFNDHSIDSANIGGNTAKTTVAISEAQGSAGAEAGTEKDKVEDFGEKKVLRVAMDCAYPPYDWTQPNDANGAVPIVDSNEFACGYDVIMAKKICEELNYDLQIVRLGFDSLIPAVQSGQADCVISGQYITSKRLDQVDFSEPYYYASIVTLVKKGSKYENAVSVADLAGATCTSQQSTIWYQDCLPQIENANILAATASVSDMLMSLDTGKCDLVVTDQPTGKGALTVYPDFVLLEFGGGDADFQVTEEDINMGISMKKGNTELKKAIDSVLTKMTRDDFSRMMDEAISVQPLVD